MGIEQLSDEQLDTSSLTTARRRKRREESFRLVKFC